MTSTAQKPDLLAAILAATERAVSVRETQVPLAQLERLAADAAVHPGRFRAALTSEGLNVIAECKRRSPSRGVLKAAYDPAIVARGYEANGAAALSVLTEPAFFDGSLDHLRAVRGATTLPILRKDFILCRYQILEARAAGADAVLLIVAALSRSDLAALHRQATEAGLDVLVEAHDLDEIRTACDAGASLIGVNNRNLRTLEVNTKVSEQAIALIPDEAVAVAESGLRTRADLERLRASGYDGFLVGERLMATDDPGRALGELMARGVA
jgi:indole-3-glycerol phosphate synthase